MKLLKCNYQVFIVNGKPPMRYILLATLLYFVLTPVAAAQDGAPAQPASQTAAAAVQRFAGTGGIFHYVVDGNEIARLDANGLRIHRDGPDNPLFLSHVTDPDLSSFIVKFIYESEARQDELRREFEVYKAAHPEAP